MTSAFVGSREPKNTCRPEGNTVRWESFSSSNRRAEQTALIQGQAGAKRLRMFLPIVAAGLDSEGYSYAKRAIGVLVAIAGWPSLVTFIYQLGSVECGGGAAGEDDERGRESVARCALSPSLRHAWCSKHSANPSRSLICGVLKAVACLLMVWWGLTAEPPHSLVGLMQQFGGHPFKTDNVREVERRSGQIRSCITSEAQKLWRKAEHEMSIYGNEPPAA